MSFGKAYFFAGSLALFVACGGTSFSGGDGDGGTGGSSSGGSSSKAGASSKGGSSSSAGSKNMGGSVSTAGSVGTAGTTSCDLVLCAYPECTDGQEPITLPGECCPTCPPPTTGCDDVACEPVMDCPMGYELGTPPGACCQGCLPIPGMVACREIACPPENHCPLGYVPGDQLGGCCYDCVPDPLFCNTADECVIADKPRSCCGCPEAISMRQYQADQCWSATSMPRMIPQECYPQQICDAVCGACPPPGSAECKNHRCVELPIETP